MTDIPNEQLLELYATNIASNDRIVTALKDIKESIPDEVRNIVQQHKPVPAPAVEIPIAPDARPTIIRVGYILGAIITADILLRLIIHAFK